MEKSNIFLCTTETNLIKKIGLKMVKKRIDTVQIVNCILLYKLIEANFSGN